MVYKYMMYEVMWAGISRHVWRAKITRKTNGEVEEVRVESKDPYFFAAATSAVATSAAYS